MQLGEQRPAGNQLEMICQNEGKLKTERIDFGYRYVLVILNITRYYFTTRIRSFELAAALWRPTVVPRPIEVHDEPRQPEELPGRPGRPVPTRSGGQTSRHSIGHCGGFKLGAAHPRSTTSRRPRGRPIAEVKATTSRRP